MCLDAVAPDAPMPKSLYQSDDDVAFKAEPLRLISISSRNGDSSAQSINPTPRIDFGAPVKFPIAVASKEIKTKGFTQDL